MKPITPVGTPAYNRERAEFIDAVTAPICDGDDCTDLSTPPTVRYGGRYYCSGCANTELVLDLGRHGLLALPALAFSGVGRC